jgi:hypothetical protein
MINNSIQQMLEASRRFSETQKLGKHNLGIFSATQIADTIMAKVNPNNTFQNLFASTPASIALSHFKNQEPLISLAGSTISHLAELNFKSDTRMKSAAGILSELNQFIQINKPFIEKQEVISRFLGTRLYEINDLSSPSWLNKELPSNESINMVESVSASTLNLILKTFPASSNTEVEINLHKTEDFIRSAEFASDFEEAFKDVKKPFDQLEKRLTHLIHRLHLRKIDVQTAYYIAFSIVGMSILILSQGIKEKIFKDKTPSSINIKKTIIHQHYYQTIEQKTTIDTVTIIRNTMVYTRSSKKTKSVCKIPQGTIVLILKEKPYWKFIQVLITWQNPKTKKDESKLIKGWIEN